jgi:hypothetical protein
MPNERESFVFLSEIRDTAISALKRIVVFEEAAKAWIGIQAAIVSWPDDGSGLDELFGRGNEQRDAQYEMFEALDDVLARWTRVSQMLFPTGRTEPARRAMKRADRLLEFLNLPAEISRTLGDRKLRDAWTHFDERLDDALEEDRLAWPQWFMLSEDLTEYHRKKIPRLVMADTLELYYHDRKGNVCCTSLRDMQAALTMLVDRLKVHASLRT